MYACTLTVVVPTVYIIYCILISTIVSLHVELSRLPLLRSVQVRNNLFERAWPTTHPRGSSRNHVQNLIDLQYTISSLYWSTRSTTIMPRFFDDYSNTYLTHDSAAGRKQQRRGWKFRENFRLHYQNYVPEWRRGEMGLAAAQQAFLRAKGVSDPAVPPLPEGWKEEVDDVTGISYYIDTNTKKRTWVRPGFVPPPPGGGGPRGQPPPQQYRGPPPVGYNNSMQQQQQQQHRPPPPSMMMPPGAGGPPPPPPIVNNLPPPPPLPPGSNLPPPPPQPQFFQPAQGQGLPPPGAQQQQQQQPPPPYPGALPPPYPQQQQPPPR